MFFKKKDKGAKKEKTRKERSLKERSIRCAIAIVLWLLFCC